MRYESEDAVSIENPRRDGGRERKIGAETRRRSRRRDRNETKKEFGELAVNRMPTSTSKLVRLGVSRERLTDELFTTRRQETLRGLSKERDPTGSLGRTGAHRSAKGGLNLPATRLDGETRRDERCVRSRAAGTIRNER